MNIRQLAAIVALLATITANTVRAESAPIIDFSLPMLSGETVALSDWRGQWVLVNYWATWCAPCRKEIPDFSQMHDARDDITVLGLAFEDTDVATFEEFLVDYPASYPILLVDVYAPPEALGAPRALPTSFLVDPEGRLVETWIGPLTSETIMARVDQTLSE
ncbi:MAG: TlpA disulfide reductase family protein [Wenzhouxiangellaceae bacterium]|nr:TlpA disulfide reductase family protein [Wenzhouxiangellaceae bacterium]